EGRARAARSLHGRRAAPARRGDEQARRGASRRDAYAGPAVSVRVCVLGPSGRMGRAVIEAAKERTDLRVASTVDFGEDMATGLGGADVYVDFTSPAGTRAAAEAALSKKTA